MNLPEDSSDNDIEPMISDALNLPDAPEAWIRSAENIWESHRQHAKAPSRTPLHEIVRATLSFDSWAQHDVAVGVRSLDSSIRHLLFEARGRDIDLRIHPAQETYLLNGQVLGPDTKGTIKLQPHANQSGSPISANLNDMGEFQLENVAQGSYELLLQVEDDEILIAPVEVGSTG